MNYLNILVAVLLALTLASCHKRDETQPSPTARDQNARPADADFLVEAAQANKAEIDAGRIAVAKTSNNDVKRFAQHMIEDHSTAYSDLKDLAYKKDFRVPSSPSQEQLKAALKLGEVSGADFDRQYMDLMVKDHEKAVSLFEKNSMQAKDADVRDWAGKILPTLQKHLKMAKETNAKVTGASPD
jgi:putative membrane protein